MYTTGNLELEWNDGVPMVMIWGGGKVIYIGTTPQEIDQLIAEVRGGEYEF